MIEILLENNVGLLTTEDSSGWLLLEGSDMATLATQRVSRAGLAPSYAAASAGGDSFNPDEETLLHVKNGGGSPVTVTIPAPATVDGMALTSVSVVVPNGSERMIGPFPGQLFERADGTGLADVTYSGVTSVTVAAVKLSAL